MASIEINGIPEIFAKLGNVGAIATLRPPMQRAVVRIEEGMRKYPSLPSGSRYRRTRRLGNAWTIKIDQSATGLVGTVGNNVRSPSDVPYGPFVQSEMFQAAQHRGRWQTDQDVATKETPAIIADFEQAIGAALR
jgi:hypothetical protein